MDIRENYIQQHIKGCKASREGKKRSGSDLYWKKLCAKKRWNWYQRSKVVKFLDHS